MWRPPTAFDPHPPRPSTREEIRRSGTRARGEKRCAVILTQASQPFLGRIFSAERDPSGEPLRRRPQDDKSVVPPVFLSSERSERIEGHGDEKDDPSIRRLTAATQGSRMPAAPAPGLETPGNGNKAS